MLGAPIRFDKQPLRCVDYLGRGGQQFARWVLKQAVKRGGGIGDQQQREERRCQKEGNG